MSDSFPFLVAIGALWASIGLVLSLTMGRRGHDGFTWLVVGTLLLARTSRVPVLVVRRHA